MAGQNFFEGVRPGGLTSSKEVRILLCYLLDSVNSPITREQIEQALLGEELVNYFAMTESLSQLEQQGLIELSGHSYTITDEGRTVGRTLAQDVPRSIREAAVRGVIRAQQYAAKLSDHHCEIKRNDLEHLTVICSIDDDSGPLFHMELYMPDTLSAEAVCSEFIENGNEIYKLVLAAVTANKNMANQALSALIP